MMQNFRALLLTTMMLGSETVNAQDNEFDFRSWVDHKEISDMSIPSDMDVQELDIDGIRYIKVGNQTGSLLLQKKDEYKGSDIETAYCASKPSRGTTVGSGSVSIQISGITPDYGGSLLKHMQLISKEILRKCLRIGS